MQYKAILSLCALVAFMVGCSKPAPMETRFQLNKSTGELEIVNQRDCDVLVEFYRRPTDQQDAALAQAADATGIAFDELAKAVKTIKTTCGQNRGFQELQSQYMTLQDQRLKTLQDNITKLIPVLEKIAGTVAGGPAGGAAAGLLAR